MRIMRKNPEALKQETHAYLHHVTKYQLLATYLQMNPESSAHLRATTRHRGRGEGLFRGARVQQCVLKEAFEVLGNS